MNIMNSNMNESILYTLSILGGIHIALCVFFVIISDNQTKYPTNLLWGLILSLPMGITGLVYEIGPKKQVENRLITNLKYIKTLEPKYVYEHDEYMFFHDENGPIEISRIQGYSTDSAAIADGIMVYQKVYPRIWGFIEQTPVSEEPEFVYTFVVTDAIKKASQEPAELK